MDTSLLKTKHIQLNKVMYGNDQHIFKTNIKTYGYEEISGELPERFANDNIEYNKFNTVFYSTFKESTDNANEYDLLDFNEMNFIYKNENQNFNYLTQYLNDIDTYYKKFFNKYLNPENADEQSIIYYKSIEKPIDIININNIGYFLSPLQINKQMEMANQDVMLYYKDYQNIGATNKPHYKQAYQYITNRTVSYAENNNIPVYDLNYNFIDTINFESLSALYNWIDTNNLLNISSNITYINSNDNYYGINMHNLLSAIALDPEYNYQYSEDAIKNIISDLLSRLNLNKSINRYIDKYGLISKLNKKYYYLVKENPILSSIFNLDIDEIKTEFYKRYVDSFTVNDIPQNTLYIANLEKTLLEPTETYDKVSTYLNYVNLKNTQNPNYEYDIEFPEKMFDIINYVDEANYITVDNENKDKFLNVSGNTTYIIKYLSGIFYVKENKFEKYKNNLGFIFYPCGIISSEISSSIQSYKINQEVSTLLSTHTYEALYDMDGKVASTNISGDNFDKFFYNKARGIDFRIPPEYIYYISDPTAYEENNRIPWYKDANTNTNYVNTYFPSCIMSISCLNNNEYICSLISAGGPNDFNSHYESQPQVSSILDLTNYNSTSILHFKIDLSRLPSGNQKFYGNCTYKIYRSSIFNDMENYIDNYVRMLYFDNDRNKTLNYNKNNNEFSYLDNKLYSNPIKKVVSSILDKSVSADNYLATINQEYATNYSDRLSGKTDNYLNVFNEYHIENNRIAEIGKLNGLRIYEHVGKITDNLIWSSYKYVALKSNSLEESLTDKETIQMNQYNINRFTDNMELDDLGDIKYQGIKNIKNMSKYPEYQRYAFIDNNKNYLCSSCFKCSLPKSKSCTEGYCTFPYNNSDKLYVDNSQFPIGVYWNLNNYIQTKKTSKYNNTFIDDEIFKLNISKTYDQKIIAKSDLQLNDDAEIYFINKNINDNDISELLNDTSFKPYTYKSLFQGFGRDNTIENNQNINYPHYLMINNKDNTYEKYYENIKINSYFNNLYTYISEDELLSTDPISTLFRYTTLNSYLKQFLNIDVEKEEIFIDNITHEPRDLTIEEKELLSTNLNTLLVNSDYGFLISGATALNESTVICSSITQIHLYSKFATNDVIPEVPAYTYRSVSLTNIFDMMLTCKTKSIHNPELAYNEILQNFINKRSLSNTYILNNGFVISPYTPFNGPHTIKADTELAGLLLEGTSLSEIKENLTNAKISTILPSNYNVYIRIINWWDDYPKFTGSILIKPTDTALKNNTLLSTTNNIINNFDFVECLADNSTLKLNQNNYKKSNIYSIKIKNSGLNPDNNEFLNTKEAMALKEYVNLSEAYKKLYDHITWNDMLELQINDPESLYDDLYYIYLNTEDTFLKSVIPSKDTISDPSNKLFIYYKSVNGYYKLNNEKIEYLTQLKIDLRNNLETAIKNSVSRYMPVETKLWKIIYEGN